MNKRLFKILSTIENAIAILLGLIGIALMICITHTWPVFFITKSIGAFLLMITYLEFSEEKE